jgi:hypothetical protein
MYFIINQLHCETQLETLDARPDAYDPFSKKVYPNKNFHNPTVIVQRFYNASNGFSIVHYILGFLLLITGFLTFYNPSEDNKYFQFLNGSIKQIVTIVHGLLVGFFLFYNGVGSLTTMCFVIAMLISCYSGRVQSNSIFFSLLTSFLCLGSLFGFIIMYKIVMFLFNIILFCLFAGLLVYLIYKIYENNKDENNWILKIIQ